MYTGRKLIRNKYYLKLTEKIVYFLLKFKLAS